MALIKSISRSLQRQVDVTTAICQERLLSMHVRHVLALVDLVSDRLPFDDAVDIYVRILRLTPEQARNVGSRALAEIGRREGSPPPARTGGIEPDAESDEDFQPPAEGGRSALIFARLRRRVRGRVHDELRDRINLSAARTENALLETHVQNALLFGRALADEVAMPEAIELYLETMTMGEGVADVIYNRALSVIAEQVLPPVPVIDGGYAAASGTPGTAEVSEGSDSGIGRA